MGNNNQQLSDMMSFSVTPERLSKKPVSISTKEWGTEYIICQSPHAAKVMYIKPGYQVSTHFHSEKSETFILISGELIVETFTQNGEKHSFTLSQTFDSITLGRNVSHTFYVPDEQEVETIFIEASTEDKSSDSYRLSKSGKRKDFTDR